MSNETDRREPHYSPGFEWIASAILWFADHAPKTVRGEAHLQVAAEHVNRGEGPLIVVSNHVSWGDPVVLRTLKRKLNANVPVFALIGDKYIPESGDATKQKPLPWLIGKVSQALADAAHVTLVPIPQDGTSLGAVKAAASRIMALRDEVVDKNGVLLIYPEGHRVNTLEKGKAGTAFIFRNSPTIQAKARILPVGVAGSILHPFEQVCHTYGEPVTYQTVEQIQADAATVLGPTDEKVNFSDACMLLIAALLPPEKQGVYSTLLRAMRDNAVVV